MGQPALTEVTGEIPESEILRIAASAETSSEHPIAQAIVRAASERSIVTSPVLGFKPHQARELPQNSKERDLTWDGSVACSE